MWATAALSSPITALLWWTLWCPSSARASKQDGKSWIDPALPSHTTHFSRSLTWPNSRLTVRAEHASATSPSAMKQFIAIFWKPVPPAFC
ncbi:glycosyl hydrolase family 65 protein [Comamonas sp.]|uniref:glycosyl hydrolase family 65 protein n=1 Tax=Comamonas sp. TaxID=34028 RepID=UPI00391863CE